MPRRGENIYKRKDGRWEGRYIRGRSPSGRAEYGYVYARSYRECRAKRQQRLESLQELPAKTSSLTLNTEYDIRRFGNLQIMCDNYHATGFLMRQFRKQLNNL